MITFENLQVKPFKNQKITGLVPGVWELSVLVPGYLKKIKNIKNIHVLFIYGKLGPCDKLWNIYTTAPQVYLIYKISPCVFQVKKTKRILCFIIIQYPIQTKPNHLPKPTTLSLAHLHNQPTLLLIKTRF